MKFIAIVVINKQDVELSIIASLTNVNSDFFQDYSKISLNILREERFF